VKLFGPRVTKAATIAALVVLATSCASTGAPTKSGGTVGTGDLTGGAAPATATAMICRTEAIQEIDSAVGVTATVSSPTWSDHVYSCTYGYPSGSMQLSVKELPDPTQTNAYYHQLEVRMGDTGTVAGLGQDAFQTTNGSVVVRKDSKVLLVDVTGLPAQFGLPPKTAGTVAVTVADVILACWSGG
jgi:hypothetical protein